MFPELMLALRRVSICLNMMWLQSWGPALPTIVSSWFPVGSVYVHTCPCVLWLAEDPSSEWPGFWEMEINSTLPSLKIQANLVVSLLDEEPGPGLFTGPATRRHSSVPAPALGQGSWLRGPARALSPAERGASAQLPPWCSWGCVTACSLLPYYHTAVASYWMCLQEGTYAAVLWDLSPTSSSQRGERGGNRRAG